MKKIITTIGLSIILAACGGGGSDGTPAGAESKDSTPVATPTAEGFW
ncbi:MAG: hypothetical protein OJF60_000283 [Burkholderiaceae bacterium]|jgi:hypothetical protein|nr:MAG: hypothetical protein OJF60_000283 [Burkholderiaceae bacterium]